MGVFRGLYEDLIRNLSGGLGKRIRASYYKRRFRKCGPGLVIEPNVHFHNIRYIELGDHVWIDKNSILIAGPAGEKTKTTFVKNPNFTGKQGEIIIGSHVHLGINSIVQGHGGIVIGDFFTSSANCSIYSLSNDPSKCRSGTVKNEKGPVFYISSPVQIGDNVWLGLGVKVIGRSIGSDCFIKPNAVVTKDIPNNSIAGGFPAEKTKNRFTDDTKKR